VAELLLADRASGTESLAGLGETGSPQATPTPLVAGTASLSGGRDAIDAQLLQQLLERVNLAPASVLVDSRLERPTWSLERKPTRKLLPRGALGLGEASRL